MEKSRPQAHNSHSPFLQGAISFPTCCTYHCIFLQAQLYIMGTGNPLLHSLLYHPHLGSLFPPRLSPCILTSAHHSVMDAALGDLNPIPHRCLSADLLGTLPWPGHLSSPHWGISDRPQPCMGSAEITLQKTSH